MGVLMNAGEYRHLITVQKLNDTTPYTQGTDGSSAENWVTLATVWAKVKPLTGREFTAAQQTQADLTHNIYTRYTPGISPDDRVVWGTRTFDIIDAVNVDERNVELILRCKEKL